MISFTQSGDFSNLTNFLQRAKNVIHISTLDKYGQMGVDALEKATPVESGETARSWRYKAEIQNGSASITFYNSHINDGVPIAIILQYGHGTRNGGWVEGIDYINPALKPIFDELAETAWKEVTGR